MGRASPVVPPKFGRLKPSALSDAFLPCMRNTLLIPDGVSQIPPMLKFHPLLTYPDLQPRSRLSEMHDGGLLTHNQRLAFPYSIPYFL